MCTAFPFLFHSHFFPPDTDKNLFYDRFHIKHHASYRVCHIQLQLRKKKVVIKRGAVKSIAVVTFSFITD